MHPGTGGLGGRLTNALFLSRLSATPPRRAPNVNAFSSSTDVASMSSRGVPVGRLQWIVMMRRGAARSAGGDGGRGVGLEEVPDAAGEVALEAADGFAAGLAFGLAAGEVGGALGVQAALGDGEAVQRAVELAVAAVVEAVALGSSGGGGDRRRAGGAGELGVGGEAGDVGDLAEQLGGGQDAAAAFGEQPRRERGDERRRVRRGGR